MEERLNKKAIVKSTTLGFIAGCCKQVNNLGIHHIDVNSGRLRTHNFRSDIYLDIDISSLLKDDANELDLQIEASPENAKILRRIGKTKEANTNNGSQIGIDVITTNDNYIFVDSHRETAIRKVLVTPPSTTIAAFVNIGQQLKTSITITGKGELSLQGNEAVVIIGVYDRQMASATLPGQPEHFFEKNTARQMQRKTLKQYKSYSFLKFGDPDYLLSLYSIQGDIWLLSKAQFGGILCHILEKLTKLIYEI